MKHYKIRQAITDRSSEAVDRYLKDIKKYPLLTDEQEKELFANLTKENSDKIIQSNLRFVVSIAKQYQGKGIELADLIAAGNIGLMQALNKFNPDMGFKFISYAVWWIRQSILEEIMNNGKTIKVPANKVSNNIRILRTITAYEQEHGIPPSEDELSEILNISVEELNNILKSNVVILGDSIKNDDGEEESIFDTIILDDYTEDDVLNDIKIAVNAALEELNPVEKVIIKDLFGFNGEPKEPSVVAEQNNITVERVRQIKDKAIIKLRKSDNIESLLKYLN
jgi:RNA polymerase primary sigma factor